MKINEVKQIGNYETNSAWDNPQTGRVYAVEGLSPTLNTCGGGGHEVKIVEETYIMPGNNFNQRNAVHPENGVCRTIMGCGHAGNEPKVIVASRGRNPDNPSDRTPGNYVEQRLEPNSQGICNTLTSVQKDNLVLEPAILTPKRTEYGKAIRKAYESGVVQESRHNMTELQPRQDGISNTLTTVQKDNLLLESTYRIRKLTPRECWRLMDFTDKDYDKAATVNSNTQLYKQAGNSIVKAVLMAIFKQMLEVEV